MFTPTISLQYCIKVKTCISSYLQSTFPKVTRREYSNFQGRCCQRRPWQAILSETTLYSKCSTSIINNRVTEFIDVAVSIGIANLIIVSCINQANGGVNSTRDPVTECILLSTMNSRKIIKCTGAVDSGIIWTGKKLYYALAATRGPICRGAWILPWVLQVNPLSR